MKNEAEYLAIASGARHPLAKRYYGIAASHARDYARESRRAAIESACTSECLDSRRLDQQADQGPISGAEYHMALAEGCRRNVIAAEFEAIGWERQYNRLHSANA